MLESGPKKPTFAWTLILTRVLIYWPICGSLRLEIASLTLSTSTRPIELEIAAAMASALIEGATQQPLNRDKRTLVSVIREALPNAVKIIEKAKRQDSVPYIA